MTGGKRDATGHKRRATAGRAHAPRGTGGATPKTGHATRESGHSTRKTAPDTRGIPRAAHRPAAALAPACLAAAFLLSLAGCVTETKTDRPPMTERRVTVRGSAKAARPANDAPAGAAVLPNEATDPCANRLHELSGALLTYYAVNKKLPDTLAEAAPFADAVAPLNADCPVSNQPYVYVPRGLQAQSQERLLVLYDAAPAHAGLRWGVFIAPPKGGQLPSTYVLVMSPEVFRSYVRE